MTGPLIRAAKVVDLAELEVLAGEDAHCVVQPSHIVERKGKMVGALSIGTVPMVLVYMNTKRSDHVDSFCVNNFIENMVSNHGSLSVCVPCHVKSPLRPFMERVGYVARGTHDLMFKTF